MRGNVRIGCMVILLLAASEPAWSQPLELQLQYPARTRGMAGTGRSFATSSNALLLNPAGLAYAVQYVFEGVYGYGFDGDLHTTSVNWTDSYMNPHVAAGVGYSFMTQGPLGDLDAHAINGGLAFPVLKGPVGLILGTGIHWVIKPDGKVKTRADGTVKKSDWNLLTGDLGAILTLGDMFRIGLVGYDLLSVIDSPYDPGLGVGISFWWSRLVFAFDVVADWGATDRSTGGHELGMSYMGGILVAATQELMFRVGSGYDQLNDRPEIAAGASLMLPKGVGIELAYTADPTDFADSFLSVGLQLYPMMWSGERNAQ